MTGTPTVPAELFDPASGELVESEDLDQLIDAYERADEHMMRVTAFRNQLRAAIAKFASGSTKTQRVRGARRAARVEKPSNYFDHTILKEIVNAYPSLWEEYIAVQRYDVKRREFAKLKTTTETVESRKTFQKMLLGAEREPTALPNITIELLEGT